MIYAVSSWSITITLEITTSVNTSSAKHKHIFRCVDEMQTPTHTHTQIDTHLRKNSKIDRYDAGWRRKQDDGNIRYHDNVKHSGSSQTADFIWRVWMFSTLRFFWLIFKKHDGLKPFSSFLSENTDWIFFWRKFYPFFSFFFLPELIVISLWVKVLLPYICSKWMSEPN